VAKGIGASRGELNAVLGAIEGAGRPVDRAELEALVKGKIGGAALSKALKSLVKGRKVQEVTRDGELLPRYSLDLFSAAPVLARAAKKSIPARAPVQPGQARVTVKPAPKPAAKSVKVKPKFGSLGTKFEKICSVRRRDVATGRLLPGCSRPSGYVYAPDGTRVKVKVSSCSEDGNEAFTYKVISAEYPDDLKADLRKASPLERATFKKHWLQVLEEELNNATAADIMNRELTREVRSEIGKRAARTRADNAAKAVKLGVQKRGTADKPRALNELEAVKARIMAARGEAQKTKSTKKLETIKRKIKRLDAAKAQLEKIAAGKASKFPTAGQLR
jgi:hypothetical protein